MSGSAVGTAVVVGVDGTLGALDAVAWAAREASLRQQPLRIVHARTGGDSPRDRAPAYQILDTAVHRARTTAPGIDVRVGLGADDPLSFLEREGMTASVLVLGPPGPGGVTRRIVESAGRLAAGRVAPLVVVPADGGRDLEGPVAVLVDTSGSGAMAIAAAAAVAARRHAELQAVLVPEPGASYADSVATVDALVARAGAVYPGLKLATQIRRGRPASVLVQLSADAALVVVGAREFGRAHGLVLGSVRHSLLGSTACPVMIVPARVADEGRGRRPEPVAV